MRCLPVPFAFALVACTSAPAAPDASADLGPDRATADVAGDVAPDAPAEAAVAVERGPARLPVDGDPNGLWWDAASATLYLADDQNNRVLSWRDVVGFRAVATLPPGPPEGAGLGQIVRLADGTLVVARFGHGTAGDVAYVSPDGAVGRVSSLDPTRRRIGLTVAGDGTLYVGWFLRQASGRVGSVSTLTLAGAEVDFLTGLSKPVGVLALGDRLLVSDQDRNELLAVDRAAPGTTMRRVAMLTGPDLLCAGPAGSVFVGSTRGVVYRVAADGAVTTFDTGYQSTRGVAWDATNRRLFVVDHDTDPADGTTNQVRIVPVDA